MFDVSTGPVSPTAGSSRTAVPRRRWPSSAADSGEGEIVGLYVLPSEWGKRIGSTLLDSALEVLREAGNRSAGLWVLAANLRPRRMYQKRGWVLCPGVGQQAHGVSEVRYRQDLGQLACAVQPRVCPRGLVEPGT